MTAPDPHGDVGVLLVHGIGDHQEGQTLATVGEALVDWLREWLRRGGRTDARGDVVVTQARLQATRTEAESPAYALARIDTTPKSGDDPRSETWLLCEAWWGGSVQPPASLKLLRWMWTRGPLLIYWHFYLHAGSKRPGVWRTASDVGFSAFAFLLAASCQFIVALAMLLWMIPIGPWRRGVISAVRALTLTLGDSYVVLEHAIQRAALVQRVHRSLAWLADRADRTIVIAHSQGAAIAHEALRHAGREVSTFITIGSGLEKLQFLRRVRDTRQGLVQAALLSPLASTGGALVAYGMTSAGERWHGVLGRGSLFQSAKFLARSETHSDRSFATDHVTYFQDHFGSLFRIWCVLDRQSRLLLFAADDRGRLRRFACVHASYARLLSVCRVTTVVAAIVSAIAIRGALVSFGESALASVAGSTVGEWLSPLAAFAGAAAWVVHKVWRPDAIGSATLGHALFGAAVLFGAIALWWVGFNGLWRAQCVRRWRRACLGRDVRYVGAGRALHHARRAAFLTVGSLPLVVSIALAMAPDVVSISTLGRIISGVLACLLFALTAAFVCGSPWVMREQWHNRDADLSDRFLGPVLFPLASLLVLSIGLSLWPFGRNPDVETMLYTATLVVAAILSQVAAITERAMLGRLWVSLIVVMPPVGVLAVWAASRGPMAGYASNRLDVVYAAITAVMMVTALGVLYRREVVERLGRIRPRRSKYAVKE